MKFRFKSTDLTAALVMIFAAAVFFVNDSTAQGKTYRIGDKGPAGGWVFYDKGSSDGGWRYLEAAPVDQSLEGGIEWGCYDKSVPGAKGKAIGTGKSNTQSIIKSCGEEQTAAKLCTAYRGGGKSDWFLPSKDELDLMFKNLQAEDIGGLTVMFYWSSSEFDSSLSWMQGFASGDEDYMDKHCKLYVRAVRAFND